MTFDQIERIISLYEKSYSGPFSESTVKDDLENKRALDSYSMLGSSPRQTHELRAKKDFYIKEFNDNLIYINKILDAARIHRSWDSMFISRCEKCKNEANKLLGIVRNF